MEESGKIDLKLEDVTETNSCIPDYREYSVQYEQADRYNDVLKVKIIITIRIGDTHGDLEYKARKKAKEIIVDRGFTVI